MKKTSRRKLIKDMMKGAMAVSALPSLVAFVINKSNDYTVLKGNINHSVCRWTYDFLPLEKLCKAVKETGFGAIDLLTPKDWPTIQQYGLFCSMCYIAGEVSLTKGFNNTQYHDQLVKDYVDVMP